MTVIFWVLVAAIAVQSARLAVFDWRSSRLPNRMVAELLALVVVLVGVEVVLERSAGCRLRGTGSSMCVASASGLAVSVGLVAVGLAIPLLLFNLVSPASVGFGDVKLAFVLSGLLGVRAFVLPPLQVGLMVLFLGMLLGAAAGLWVRRSEGVVPAGPGLIVGAWIVLVGLVLFG